MEEVDKMEEEVDKETIVIIMAGGLGKRMQSETPKVLHRIRGLPMIVHLLLAIKQIQTQIIKKIFIVVGKYHSIIESTIFKYVDPFKIQFIHQKEALGTGHAIQCCRDELLLQPPSTNILILSGDVPLLTPTTMEKMLEDLSAIRIITTRLDEPKGYGRIITDKQDKFQRIVEEKDATDKERAIQLVNGGIYAVSCGLLCRYLPMILNNNEQREYYLTDIVEIIQKNEGVDVDMLEISMTNQREIMGVNTLEELERLNQLYQSFQLK
jgi:UDP-N-acetylglucosamine diphosphorylase/glucosamine-1-phosphate N-acetyltransferase